MSMLRSQCLLVKMVMFFWGPQQQHTPDPLTLEFIELAGSQLKTDCPNVIPNRLAEKTAHVNALPEHLTVVAIQY